MTVHTITIDFVIREVAGITRPELDRWIENQWVRPDAEPTGYVFAEIDLARVRLIRELTSDLQVNDDTIPVVLNLLDQIYDLRRRLRTVSNAASPAQSDDRHI
jgi:chaperone modulatory protein CbpM